MMAYIARLAALAVFSSLAVNFVLQLGFGLLGITRPHLREKKMFAVTLGIQFIIVLFLWLLLIFIRFVMPLGFYEFILIFPASYLFFTVLEYLAGRFILTCEFRPEDAMFPDNTLRGSVPASVALFITLNTAGTLLEAVILCAGFVLGIVLAVSISTEIRKRSELEAVPCFMRGGPLALVALGLLSLIFTSSALMLFEVLGAG